MSEFSVDCLLTTSTLTIRDVYCKGSCRHPSAEEAATATQLVFPYRGVYVRHLGADQAVAEANQVLFSMPMKGIASATPSKGATPAAMGDWEHRR